MASPARTGGKLKLLSDEVLKVSTLEDLRIREVDAKLIAPAAKPPFKPEGLLVHPSAGLAENYAIYDYVYTLSAVDGRSKEVASFRLACNLVCQVSRSLSNEELHAFSRVAGLEIAHPYIRELVHSLTVRMGLPALIIDVYAPKITEIGKNVGE